MVMERTRRVFKLKSDLFKALSNPLRLAIIETLKGGERSVGEIVRASGSEQSSVSKNLSVLRHAGILGSRQEGATVYYGVRDQDIFKILRVVSDILAARHKESAGILADLGKR
jgi:ArsR family transcriptional regulator